MEVTTGSGRKRSLGFGLRRTAPESKVLSVLRGPRPRRPHCRLDLVQGRPAGALTSLDGRGLELLVSPNLLAELARVLGREKFRRCTSEREAQAYVAFLRRFATLRADVESPARLSPDPGDDYLLALARSRSADFLVSGDSDLCQLENTQPPVLTPRALLNRLQ